MTQRETFTRDERFMQLAIAEAKKGAACGEVPVGAVVVRNDAVIATGYNRRETGRNALFHAETEAISSACHALRDWRLTGCELFVTLEPCAMCAGAVVGARMRRVVFGAFDSEAGCMGSVTDISLLRFAPPMELIGGVLEEECGDLLRRFFKIRRAPRPSPP